MRVVSLSHTLKPKRIIGGFTLAAVLVVSAKLPEWLFPDVCNTMTGSLWVTLLVLFVYAVLIILLSRRRRWLRSATMVLMALCIAVELTGNTLASLRNLDKEMHFEKRSTYASYFKQGNELKNALKNAVARDADIKSDDFFRVENSRARNANDGMSSGYHAVSHYSSFSRRDTFGFLKNCGMMCLSANKIFRYYGSTSALDAILGVRYVFSKYERRSGYIDTGIEVNDLKLWKNINSLPLTFFADGSILDVKTDGSPFDCLNRFLNSFDKIQRTYYTPLVVTDSIDGGEIKKNSNTQPNYCRHILHSQIYHIKPARPARAYLF